MYHCFVNLLPCFGDIESNSGPSTEDLLKIIRDVIRDLKQTTNSKLRESTDKLSAVDRKLDNIASTVTKYTSKVDALQETVDRLGCF